MRSLSFLFIVTVFAACSTTKFTEKTEKVELIHVWYVDVFEKYKFGSQRHEFASPLIVGNDLFQGGSDGRFVVVNKHSGFIKRFIKNSGGMEASPLFSKGFLYFGNSDGDVKAFSYRTGKYVWSYRTGFPMNSTPCICSGRLFILGSNDTLYAFDASTGKVLWTVRRNFPANRPVIKGNSSPVCYENIVYVGFSDGTFNGINVFDGSIVLEKNLNPRGKFKDVDATPYVDEEIIIVPSYDGNLYCLNRKTGNILWDIKDGSAKSVTVFDGVVYFSSNEGYIYALNISNGSMRWSVKLKKGIPTMPAILGKYLVVGSSERGIILYSRDDGKFVKEFNSGSGVFADPVVDRNNIYFFSDAGVLYSLTKM